MEGTCDGGDVRWRLAAALAAPIPAPALSPALAATQAAPFAAAAVPACAAAAAAAASVARSEAAAAGFVNCFVATAEEVAPKDAALTPREAATATQASPSCAAGHLLPLRGLPGPGRAQLRPLCHRPGQFALRLP